MPEIVFATCDQQPLITPDDQILADALSGHGVSAVPIPWTQIDPYAVLDSPPILLRSTWDYHRMPTMFLAWLQALEDSGRPVWNPAAVARNNVDKIYLRELEAAASRSRARDGWMPSTSTPFAACSRKRTGRAPS